MKKLLLLLLLLLSTSCGSRIATVELCFYADYITNGVCVITNGYDINRDMIDFVINITEEAFNSIFERTENLPIILEEIKTSVEYVDRKDHRLLTDNGYARGITRGKEILVHIAKDDTLDTIKCIEHYYVFGHELLHVMSNYILKDDRGHYVPNVFLTWAYKNDLDPKSSVEFYVYIYTVYECEALYGELPEDW